MTVDLAKPRTVVISRNCVAGKGYAGALVDVDEFLPVYRTLKAHLDVEPDRPPIKYSALVYRDLLRAGWDPEKARYYAQAARLAYTERLDPETGQPLTGRSAIHPVRLQEITNLVRSAMPATMDGSEAGAVADRVVDVLAAAGLLNQF